MQKAVTLSACLAVAAMFAAMVAGPFSPYLAVASVGLGIAAISSYVSSKRASRYDLAALRALHESGGPPPEDDLPEIPDDAGIVCPHCGTVYAAWMLVCPQCGH